MNVKFIIYCLFVIGVSTILSWQDFLSESNEQSSSSSGSSSYRGSSSSWGGGGHK